MASISKENAAAAERMWIEIFEELFDDGLEGFQIRSCVDVTVTPILIDTVAGICEKPSLL